ncbi:PAS domain S-box protein [Microvirga lotononidis]|uniref:histidine kinase n=1 Tax=Microvirga lotononidis TaxID=864069 RepID=I4Z430_9HYPH|nr:PAS domain S-box protein [Microvirga lotononidis]EIM30972.1 PAS domain S-box [Microvirga lotononidis]WQO30267.1 PAS domain S-box protein [Microvirga lotononidis]
MQAGQTQGQDQATSPIVSSRVLRAVSAVTAIGIFILDTMTPAEIAVAVLYVGVVLLTAKVLQARGVVLVAVGCMALTMLSYVLAQHDASPSIALSNRLLSLAAIGVTAFLAVHSRSRETVLREQAGLLDLTHDTIFVRDPNDVITYWNRGAEEQYGWNKGEAIGQVSHQLTQTIFPRPLEEITAELLRTGRWDGELVHTRKDGTQAIVASRWSMRRDARGRPVAILETNNDITERKRAEEALRESEEQWKAVFECNPTMYFMADAAGTILSVNPFGAEQLGYTVDELVRTPVLSVFYEPDRETVQRNIASCFAQPNKAMSWEVRKVRKDGTELWVRETARSVLLRKCQVILVACEDTTERKCAQEAARRSEQELRDLIENLPAMVYIVLPGPFGPIAAFASRGWREYSGLSQEDTAGSGWQSVVHPADLERNLEKWRVCAAVGEPYENESRYRRAADGAYRWFLDRAVPLRDEHGTILKWYGILTDIEDRKRAEAALRRSEHYLAEAQRLSHTGSCAYTPATEQVIYWSEEMFRIYGLDPQRSRAPDVNELACFWHPDDRDRVLERIRTAVCEKAEYAVEHGIVLPDGTVKHLHVSGHPVFDDTGAVVEYVGTVMDVTERRRAEEALHKAQAELAHVTRVTTMSALTASIAHEVNQPLGAIVTNANAALRWLAHEPPELDEARETLERITRDGHRASEVIGRVRALLRKKAAVAKRVNLNDLIQNVVALVHGEVSQHRILLRTEQAPDLPPVMGDHVQLQQVLLNLVLNGIEAMKDVTERPRELLIRSRREEAAVLVAVQDTGVGLESQNAGRMFEAFYTTKAEGMGMGLAICRSIIEAHGGRLWASANEPRGAVFHFSLPVDRDRPL